MRYVGAYFSVALVLWTRYGLHAVIMTLWIAMSKQCSFRSANPMFQIARGALLAFSSAMAFAALRRMPVAEFTAIVMLTPVIATLVARIWLDERISPLRWTLVAGGFCRCADRHPAGQRHRRLGGVAPFGGHLFQCGLPDHDQPLRTT